jgi:hypothetical protein
MDDTDVQIDFYAPAILRKWPSLNNERVSASFGSCPYLVVEGSLEVVANRGKESAENLRVG